MEHLDPLLTQDYPTGRGPGQVYLKECGNVISYTAYILWDKGRPWRIGWPCANGKQRVRCSPCLLPPLVKARPQNPADEAHNDAAEEDQAAPKWLPGGLQFNISRFRHAGYAAVQTSATSFAVSAPNNQIQALIKRWHSRARLPAIRPPLL